MYRKIIILMISMIFIGCNHYDNETNVDIVREDYESVIETLNQKIKKLEIEKNELKGTLESVNDEIDKYKKELNLQRVENTKIKPWDVELKILTGNRDHIRYVIHKKELYYDVINIIGFDGDEIKREVYEAEVIQMKGNGSKEFVKINIYGSIIDFELCEIEFDKNWEISDYKIIDKVDFARNSEIMIETTLSEGVPTELIRWKDDEGNLYEEFLSYDGLGISGSIILP